MTLVFVGDMSAEITPGCRSDGTHRTLSSLVVMYDSSVLGSARGMFEDFCAEFAVVHFCF